MGGGGRGVDGKSLFALEVFVKLEIRTSGSRTRNNGPRKAHSAHQRGNWWWEVGVTPFWYFCFDTSGGTDWEAQVGLLETLFDCRLRADLSRQLCPHLTPVWSRPATTFQTPERQIYTKNMRKDLTLHKRVSKNSQDARQTPGYFFVSESR